MGDISFYQWLAKLQVKVRVIEDEYDEFTKTDLEKAVDACNSYLSQLWSHARVAQIDIAQFMPQLTDLEYKIQSLKFKAEKKKDENSGFWGFIRQAINFITSLFGFGPLLPGSGKSAGLLSFIVEDDFDD